MTPTTRVVVTGLGVVSPLGNDIDTFWRRLVSGESGVGPITRFDTSDYKVHIAAEVKDFDAEDFIDKRKVRRLDLFSRYAVAAAKLASADAEFDPRPEADRVGAVIGSGVGGLQTLHTEIDKLLTKGPDRVNPLLVPMMIPNMGAAHVSLELGTKGPLSATVTACAAGSDAIGYAARIIRHGDRAHGRRGRLRRRPRAESAQR
jgi:3-oxoacyl-[acyl-carrier-protein] synthase II